MQCNSNLQERCYIQKAVRYDEVFGWLAHMHINNFQKWFILFVWLEFVRLDSGFPLNK